jgi:putative transcriptional regulator
MTIHHHLDDSTLMSCAAGSQPEALAAVVASHLAVCPRCRGELETLSLIGETLFDSLAPVPVTREAPVVAARASEADEDGSVRIARRPADPGVPDAVASVMAGRAGDVHWRRLAPGIWHYPLELSAGAEGDLRLIKVAPGHTLPEHGHGGSEITLILDGAYSDEFGTFQKGDVADLGDDAEHRPVADKDQGCICLIASDRKARFKGFIARLMQPLTGL